MPHAHDSASAPCLVIRCDADTIMGFGHFYRQLSLAQTAHAMGWRVVLCTHHTLPLALQEAAREAHILLEASSESRGSLKEAHRVKEVLTDHAALAVIVDGYHFSPDYIEALHGPSKVVFFEDDGTKQGRAHLVVNLSPGSAHLDYSGMPGTPEFALGPEFALLRRQFLSHRPSALSPREQVTRVLVTLGGGDMSAEVEVVLQALAQAGYRFRCDVMSGSMDSDRLRALRTWCTRDLRFDVHIHRNVTEVAALMAPQHLAICAAGGTSWELACLGVPMLQAQLFDNQHLLASHLARHGVTEMIGGREAFTPSRIGEHVRMLMADAARRHEMSRRGWELVDGRGAKRLLERIAML